ncbi:5974_t:CDS:2, partial [Ambispora leptoticha]
MSIKNFWYEPFIDNGILPDFVLRAAIRHILRARANELEGNEFTEKHTDKMRYIEKLKERPIAEEQEAANKQHYEVSTEFMKLCLGKRMKYSCSFFPTGKETLNQAEDLMLESYCKKSQVEDGMKILDLGCGWGSLCLYICEKYPNVKVTALSNSNSQRKHIQSLADKQGYKNLTVITADIKNFDFGEESKFDRIISIEMFEHMKNYEHLLQKISNWLTPDGLLFLHTFAHKSQPYDFVADDSWMTKYFFTGGTMPSSDLFLHFQNDLVLVNKWFVNGKHYSKTSEEWLKLVDKNKNDAFTHLVETYGRENATTWFNRWRTFYIAVAEFFGMNDGNE